jgi:hypothetical protein
MRISSLKIALASALLTASISAHAAYVTVAGCDGGASVLTTCEVGATVIDFNSGVMPANITFDGGSGGRVVSGDLAGQYAAPAGDTTPFLAIPTTTAVGSVDVYLGASYNYFGLYWGSIDDFNNVTFLNHGNVVASYSGASVLADTALEGNQVAAGSNEYINFFFGPQSITDVIMSSTNYAFESDNLSFDNVPEPTMTGLLALGLIGGIVGFQRRRSGSGTAA